MADNGQYDSQINLEQEEYEQETTIEQEDSELEITMQPEAATVYGGSVVNSINGQVGDVILTTSDLENTSDYQTGTEVQSAIDSAVAGKQDTLTAGTNIQINNDVISATDTTYSAGSGLNLDGTTFSVNTNTIATVQDVTNEATTRENSDANLQGQIDALTVSSDVIDVLGTYQDLQNYDTTHVKANDIIKVLQDSTHNNAMSYYRWVIADHVGAWVYVGSEGPYYTKSEADALLNDKQNTEDNSLDTTSKTIVGAINEVNSIAKGANQALSFASYPYMINDFNVAPNDKYQIGQNVMIVTISVPDLWVSGIEPTSVRYTYRGDSAFLSELSQNGYVQVGYYKVSALETQKVDLTDYVTTTDYASLNTGGVVKVNPSYGINAASTGTLIGVTKDYTNYTSGSDLTLVDKGTLENVIEGKGLVSNTDYGSFATAGVVKASSTYGTQFASTGAMYAQTKTYEQYTDSTSPGLFIGKGTLENVIEGKGLVSETDLADYVKNTDYATSSTAGVVRIGTATATYLSSDNRLSATTRTYADYTSGSDAMFVGKGTLENVITGKGLVDQTALAGKQDTLTAGTGINITNNVISATGGGGGGVGNNVFYGTCATSASTAAKVVVCEDFTASELVAGTRLTVYFTNGNTYNGQTTLNVNGTGAKNLYYNGTTTNARYMWAPGESVEFVYNGTQWATVNGGLASTTYYGVTKLATTAGSDSQVFALTPRALFYFANYSIAPYYSASETYAVGDKVRYTYYLYECITAIDTPEAWTEAHWQQIDTLQEQIDGKQDVLTAGTGISINNNVISATGGGGGVSDVQIAGTSVVNAGVANIDYANSATGGVIKTSSTTGTGATSAGVLYASNASYNTYGSASSNYFISKGTLENVIEGKGLVDQTDLATKQDVLTAGNGINIANNVISATGGGDTVYSSKTTSNSATGGAVYIGNLGTDQTEVADPSPNDNHYKYFWALPWSNNGATYGQPGNGSVNILGSAKGVNTVAIGSAAGSGSYGSAYAVMIGNSANAGPEGVSIGDGAGTSQDFTGNVCIGAESKITTTGITNSVTLGRYSTANRSGEVNVGTGTSHPTAGFNSTQYRVIGGVHDGQELHDAATVAQGNKLMTAAPTTSDVGVLGQLWTDTTNMHTYQCTAISGSTYTWTQRW